LNTHRPVPLFRNRQESFAADSCEPLIAAVRRGEVALQALVHGHYPGRKLPPGELPALKTTGYWDARQNQTWGLPWHRNEGIEITFVESGRMAFADDEREYLLQPGTLTITRPWQRHRLGNPFVPAGKLHWLILDVGVRRPNQPWKWPPWILLRKADRDELAAILRQTDQLVWEAQPKVRECFHAIAAAVETDRDGSSISTLSIRINELLLLILTLFRRKKPVLDEALTTSRRTVELFLANLQARPEQLLTEWTVREMARSCGLGVTQFVHVVKQLTNMTPFHFLNYHRLERAAGLLRSGDQSITDLAQECGYSSSQYFATLFHRRFGCSPTQYRERGGAA